MRDLLCVHIPAIDRSLSDCRSELRDWMGTESAASLSGMATIQHECKQGLQEELTRLERISQSQSQLHAQVMPRGQLQQGPQNRPGVALPSSTSSADYRSEQQEDQQDQDSGSRIRMMDEAGSVWRVSNLSHARDDLLAEMEQWSASFRANLANDEASTPFIHTQCNAIQSQYNVI